MPNLTPRWVLQYWGTEVCRKGFHDDIWIASVENKLRTSTDDIVISDCRFPNEIKSIKEAGGIVVRVIRGPEPEWYQDALNANAGRGNMSWLISTDRLKALGIHSSETAWVGTKFDAILDNNNTIDDLYTQVRQLIKSPESDHPDANDRPLYIGLVDSSHI